MMNAIGAAILMLALSVCAQAGDGIIQNGSPNAASPAPAVSSTRQEEPEASAEGIIQNGLTAASQATMEILQSFLALL